uniref:Lipocalin/cytosolic fatty-acid binding domain-containing protein n=1 Tax=Monodelphis domestica TaxID=13616 RepID=A0A5F8HG46_MONDO
MALSPMMTGVILLGSLRSQLRKSDLPIVPRLSNIPLQMNFIAEQFQGKWYVVGVAGNAFTSEEQGRFKMYTTAYDLQKDNSYIVTSTILRDNLCDRFVRTFVQKDRPGQFTLGNLKSEHGFLWVRLGLLQCAGPKDRPIKMGGRVMRYPTSKQGEGCYFWHHLQGPASTLSFLPPGYGLQDYFIRVVKTDYNNYAVVYFKKTVNNVDYFKITLYGGYSVSFFSPLWLDPWAFCLNPQRTPGRVVKAREEEIPELWSLSSYPLAQNDEDWKDESNRS